LWTGGVESVEQGQEAAMTKSTESGKRFDIVRSVHHRAPSHKTTEKKAGRDVSDLWCMVNVQFSQVAKVIA
jgi:hypothetical protein